MLLLILLSEVALQSEIDGMNLDFSRLGHRGGVLGLVPENSAGSFALGAQAGADYLDPDLVISSDCHLVVLHDIELSRSTDIANHSEFANRSRTMTGIFWRGDPANYSEGQPASIGNGVVNITGWFVHDFTVSELKTLRMRSSFEESPFNNVWSIMTFNESLNLTNTLSATLGRSIDLYVPILLVVGPVQKESNAFIYNHCFLGLP